MPRSTTKQDQEAGRLPVVACVGASAGGIKAFSDLLANLQPEPGLALVLILHLAPDRTSGITGLLARHTRMPVVEAADGMPLEGGHVYVIAPDTTLTLSGGCFRATPRGAGPRPHQVDDFMESLAVAAGRNSLGIVLSGTGEDGVAGLRAIKAAGGTTFVQDATAEHHGMPEAAARAGVADRVMAPAAIASAMLAVARRLRRRDPAGSDEHPDRDFDAILRLLQRGTGIDFTRYKPASLHRRILRRAALAGSPSVQSYLRRLEGDQAELERLGEDVLINVTAFFRDPATFQALAEHAFPALVAASTPRTPIRIWVPGCSMGEEPYSLVMALMEHLHATGEERTLQVFATDVDDDALVQARAGVYPPSITKDVSPERLKRFFTLRPDGRYQLERRVRDCVVFARHDVTADPPFSRLDLLSCHNLLIYLGAAVQQRLMATFHYAIRPGGFLSLGPAETVGRGVLFEDVGQGTHLYRRNAGPPARPAEGYTFQSSPRAAPAPPVGPGIPAVDLQAEADRLRLEFHAPPGLLVSASGEVLLLCGDTGPFVQPGPGKPGVTVEKLVREDLQPDLAAALANAAETDVKVRRERIPYQFRGARREVTIEVHPFPPLPSGERVHLVLFESLPPPRAGARAGPPAPAGERAELEAEVARLHTALDAQAAHHRRTMRRLEAANDELRTAQEELLSTNEEYQSTNEELETAKEELQSSYEELSTINDQQRELSEETARLAADLEHVLAALPIPIVILDASMRVRRATDAAHALLNVRPTDAGRPITELRPNLVGVDLAAVLREVAAGAAPEREVEATDGTWYSLRARPFQANGDAAGFLLAFLDVSASRHASAREARARELAESVIDAMRQPLLLLDAGLHVLRANQPFYEAFELDEAAVVGKPLPTLQGGLWDVPALRECLDRLARDAKAFSDFEVSQGGKPEGARILLVNGRRVPPQGERPMALVLTMEDVTRRRVAREMMERIRLSEIEDLERLNRFKADFIGMAAHELSNPLTPIQMQLRLMARGTAALDERQARSLAIIQRNTERMARLVADMLVAARYQSGRLQVRPQPLDLGAVLAEALDTSKEVFEEHGVGLEGRPATAWVNADPQYIGQVVHNLLGNAAKYTGKGGRAVARIEAGPTVRLIVEDNGIGIGAKDLERLFEPFTRVHDTALAIPGTGLGLYICRGIVEMHGGKLTAASGGTGKGSSFVVELPAIPAPADQPPLSQPPRSPRDGEDGRDGAATPKSPVPRGSQAPQEPPVAPKTAPEPGAKHDAPAAGQQPGAGPPGASPDGAARRAKAGPPKGRQQKAPADA